MTRVTCSDTHNMTDLEAMQTWLQSSYSLQVPPDWLSACVEWIQQEHAGQPMPSEQLQAMVFEQWLMSDLKELGSACLPASLPMQLSTHAHGPLALQVESMLDVGVPLYGQLQKVKGTLNANSEVSADRPQQPAWEPKSSRMMLLKMTDGQTAIQGMEYRPIPALTADLQPGFKIVVHGPVACRRGVLMLSADNVQVLGGEVDSLMETNTPLAVLQQAMEINATNNGKHAKKEFSGRFNNKQDYKPGFDDKQQCKREISTQSRQRSTSYVNRTGNLQGGSGSWRPDVKKEPLSQPDTVDDEWEEDLDYGGILHTIDVPMDEEADKVPSASSQAASSTAPPQGPLAVQRNNPFAGSARANRTTQSAHTSTSSISSGSTFAQSNSVGLGRLGNSSNLKAQKGQSAETLNTTAWHGNGGRKPQQVLSKTKEWQESGRRKSEQALSLETGSGTVADDNMWEDDDDFELAQADADFLSPVIPVQSSFRETLHSTKADNPSDAVGSGIGNLGPNGIKLSSSQIVSNASSNQAKLKVVNNFNSSSQNSNAKSASKSSGFVKNSTNNLLPPTSRSSSNSSAVDTKPPPPKQRKLTSMFSRMKNENRSDSTPAFNTNSPILSNNTVDLTVCDSLSPASGRDHLTLKQGFENIKQEQKDDLDKNNDCCDVEMVEETKAKKSANVEFENIPKAVISPFNSEGEPAPSSREPQSLKNVLGLLQSGSGRENTFTIKGYITTLTDRLRSCNGDGWSLSCRVTDGTATVDVAIADWVLSGLIGFSAKESITFRQQAKKDARVKEFLTEGLQKCQKALIEFSGLIDLHSQEGETKPQIVGMVQLETKKR